MRRWLAGSDHARARVHHLAVAVRQLAREETDALGIANSNGRKCGADSLVLLGALLSQSRRLLKPAASS
jgi:hypothetical protein